MFFIVILIYMNLDLFNSSNAGNIVFSIWFFSTVVLTFGFYTKAALTDPGTIRT